jgi:uncharacterized cupredoxin-like copper-binding protein
VSRGAQAIGTAAVLVAFAAGAATIMQPSNEVRPSPTREVIAGEMFFWPDVIHAAGDTVDLALVNRGSLEHDFSIDELRLSPNVRPGQTIGISFGAVPGRYEVYCSLPGHREQGMTAELIVHP